MHGRVIEKVLTGPAVIVHAEDMQQGRFAGSRRTHYGDEIAFGYVEIDVAQDVKRLPMPQWITAFEVAKANHVMWESAIIGSARVAR